MRFSVSLFGKTLYFRVFSSRTAKDYEIVYVRAALELRNQDKKYVKGYTNRCKDGKYIIFIDYDRLEFEWIVQELKELQRYFKLGDFHIFESSPGKYHAVSLDKVHFLTYLAIVKASSADTDFIDVPLRFGRKVWTLRLTGKNGKEINYAGIVQSKYDHNTQSLAHCHVLNDMFNLKLKPFRHDGCEELITCRYPI